MSKKAELFEWMRFCKQKIDPIDKKWNKRLEDVASPPSSDDEEARENYPDLDSPNNFERHNSHERGNVTGKISPAEAAKIRAAIAEKEEK